MPEAFQSSNEVAVVKHLCALRATMLAAAERAPEGPFPRAESPLDAPTE